MAPTWDYLQTGLTFPVVDGTVVKITCDTGYVLFGDRLITCQKGERFTQQNDQPHCGKLGKKNEVLFFNIMGR